MPSSNPELQAKWKSEHNAVRYLRQRGWILLPSRTWIPVGTPYEPDEEELSAIKYLVEEWDYGGRAGEEEMIYAIQDLHRALTQERRLQHQKERKLRAIRDIVNGQSNSLP